MSRTTVAFAKTLERGGGVSETTLLKGPRGSGCARQMR